MVLQHLTRSCKYLCRRSYTIQHVAPSATSLSNNNLPTAEDLNVLERNVMLRQHKNNVPLIRQLLEKLQATDNSQIVEIQDLQQQLQLELRKLPNVTHKRLLNYGAEPLVLSTYEPAEVQQNARKKYLEFSDICKAFNLLRTEHLGNFTGHKSYYLLGALARLEQALIQYSLSTLKQHNFELMSVPDLLPSDIIEACGMQTHGERTQVYKLDNDLCLSGTSEMALAGYFKDQIIEEVDLPLKFAAVSRCYRAETSGLHEEKGIYRVHQFTKVEMFTLCKETTSEQMLDNFRDIEIDLYKRLALQFRLLDMPPCELGAPAYQKYDIEAWMPGRQMWGEISSCSNCTDYQSKRLNIKYRAKDGQLHFVHTINGTAAAIPRLLIAIIESQQTDNAIKIPTVLREYFTTQEIKRNKFWPDLKIVKHIKSTC